MTQGALHTERAVRVLQPSIETDRRGTGEYRSAAVVLRYATTSARSFSFLKREGHVRALMYFGFCR